MTGLYKLIICYNFLSTTSRYFGVDIIAIQEYAKTYDDIQHIRAEIRSVITNE